MISVIVQGVPGRGVAWERSRASIEASDIGQNYELMLHPPGMLLSEYFLTTLRRALDAPTEFTLRLEDDAIINQHILHNLQTWPDIHREDFGAGWVFSPVTNRGRWTRRELHSSVGLLLKRSVLPQLISRHEAELAEKPDRIEYDLMFSHAIYDSGLFIYIHYPSLVEHPIDVPSTLGHKHTKAAGTTSGQFKPAWRRDSC